MESKACNVSQAFVLWWINNSVIEFEVPMINLQNRQQNKIYFLIK